MVFLATHPQKNTLVPEWWKSEYCGCGYATTIIVVVAHNGQLFYLLCNAKTALLASKDQKIISLYSLVKTSRLIPMKHLRPIGRWKDPVLAIYTAAR